MYNNKCLPRLAMWKYEKICLAEFVKRPSSSALLRHLRLPTGGNLSPALVLVCTQLCSEQVSTCTTLVRLFSQLLLNSNRGPPCEPGPPLAPDSAHIAIWPGSSALRILVMFVKLCRSRGSSGSIVSDYGLDDWGLIPGRGKGFFF
jgi:hypothetical protein